MKKHLFPMLMMLGLTIGLSSCQSEEFNHEQAIPQNVIDNLNRLGLSTDNVIKTAEGYLVEGDIYFSEDRLNSDPHSLTVPNAEQYHTFNLVDVPGASRTITIKVDRKLPNSIKNGVDAAIARYQAQGISLVFSTGKGKADIQIKRLSDPFLVFLGVLASAGFPSGGDPYNEVLVNEGIANWDANTITTIIAHELGHCIGFRHTDWYNRNLSCGGSGVDNEGQENDGVGAVHIPGTPDKNDPVDGGSWMLSCIGNGIDRPFTADDQTALGFLY